MARRAPVSPKVQAKEVFQEFCTHLENNTIYSDLLLFDVELDGTVISNGTFVVKSATLYDTQYVTAKALRRDYRSVERFVTECKFVMYILKNSVHPNILRMYGFADGLGECPHLIMEYMSRPLTEFIKENRYYKRSYYDSELKLHIARDIANGLSSKYLHSHTPAYIHCGLTCGNILLTEGNQAKLSNFSRIKTEKDKLPEPCNELRSYLPPEVLGGASNDSKKCVDMYAFAKVVYYISTDTIPSMEEPEIGYDEELITEVRIRDVNHHCLHTIAVERIFNETYPENRISACQAYQHLRDEVGPVVRPNLDHFKPVVKSKFSSIDEYTSGHGSEHSSRTQIPAYLRNEILTDSQLVKIAFNYVHNWQSLAAALGLTDTEEEEIRERYSAPMDRKRAMLRKWHQKFHPNDTVEKLLNGFYVVGRNSDARNVLRMLESDHKNSIGGSEESSKGSLRSTERLKPLIKSDTGDLKCTVAHGSPNGTATDTQDTSIVPDPLTVVRDVSVGGQGTERLKGADDPDIEVVPLLPDIEIQQLEPQFETHDDDLVEANRGWRRRLSDLMNISTERRRIHEREYYNISGSDQED